MWLSFLVVSVVALVLAILVSLTVNTLKFEKKKKPNPFNILFAGVFVAAFLMMLPIHLAATEITFLSGLKAVLLSIVNSVQVFAFGCDYEIVKNGIAYAPENLNIIYQVWICLVFVFAPIFTFSFVLSLFQNIWSRARYLKAFFKDVYVFSELNDKALALASDIRKNHKKACIVFNDVFKDNVERVFELTQQAKKLGAITFKTDISVVNYKKHSNEKVIRFFAIGSNETENLNQALRLIENYKNRKNTFVYVFSTKLESELLLTDIDKGEVKVHRINEVKSLINRTLYEKGNLLFESAKEIADGKKQISAVIIGMGNYGKEMVKALSWFGQMEGYKLKIDAFDKDPLAEEKFVAIAPELMSPKYNGVYVEGEAQYKITVHSPVNTETVSFINKINKLKDATYVFVALGNDDVNISTAVNLRMCFERLNIHPVIQAVVQNSQQKTALEGIKNFRKQSYDIEFIGDLDSSYTEDVIIDSELEDKALKLHLKWGDEEEFWTYEYNYNSSMASAIHIKAREWCGFAEDNSETIAALEHKRWNAYMRSEGYVFSGSKDKSSRNDLAKMHHDLVDYSSLDEQDKEKDRKIINN